jgi:hypothetical protein
MGMIKLLLIILGSILAAKGETQVKIKKLRWQNASKHRVPGYGMWFGKVGTRIVCTIMGDGKGRYTRHMECWRYFGDDRIMLRKEYGNHKNLDLAKRACEKMYEEFIRECVI